MIPLFIAKFFKKSDNSILVENIYVKLKKCNALICLCHSSGT